MSVWPDNPIVHADSAVEVIVWLIVAAIWVTAQAIARARQKKELTETAPTPPLNQPQDLDEFFKLLRQQFAAGQTPPAPPAPPAKAKAPTLTPHLPKRSVRHTVQPTAVPPHSPTPPPITTPTIEEYPTPPQVPVPVSFESIQRDILSLKVSFPSRGMRFPHVRATSKFHRQASSVVQHMFHSRQRLKTAFVARAVLGSPRSVRPWLYPED